MNNDILNKLLKIIKNNETSKYDGSGCFVVKTAMLSPFSAKKLPQGRKADRITATDFAPTERNQMTERHLNRKYF